MPVYDRTLPSGTKQRRIRVWVNGKSHEKPWSADVPRKEALAEEKRWHLELLAAEPVKASPGKGPVRLFDFCAEGGDYFVHAKAHLRPSTFSIRLFKLGALCNVLGDLPLTKITTEEVERYKAARVKQGRAPETINGELAALSAVLGYARDLGIPCASPKFRHLTKRGKGRVKAWTREQVALLLAAAERHRPEVYPLILCLAYTGMRKGEGIACETSWVDLDADVLRIEPNEDWSPKDGEPREVPIEPPLRPWLEKAQKSGRRHAFVSREGVRWAGFPRSAFEACVALAGQCEACAAKDAAARAEELRERMLRARSMRKGASDGVRGEEGVRGREEALSTALGSERSGRGTRRLDRAAKRAPVREREGGASVPADLRMVDVEPDPRRPSRSEASVTRCKACAPALKGSPHKLRHSYASTFLAAGGSMFALSRILGHASIRTTERVYASFLPEALDCARGRVSFGPSPGPARVESRRRWGAK